jgi:hypothetical protein
VGSNHDGPSLVERLLEDGHVGHAFENERIAGQVELTLDRDLRDLAADRAQPALPHS